MRGDALRGLAMEWYGWILLGVSVAAMGVLMWMLPGYAPSGVSHSSLFPPTGILTSGIGVGLVLRGLWQAAS